jgi:twitching motility protein PilI
MNRPTTDFSSDPAVPEPAPGARRTRLREFQAQLVERMQAATSGTQAQARQLGVQIGESRWLLNLREAGEIVPVGTLTKVPLTQTWFLGLTNIRGNLTSVVDLAHFAGAAPTAVDKESRIVAFGAGLSFNGGLLVSRVLGLRDPGEMQLQDASDGEPVAAWAPRRYLDRDQQLWTELDLATIVQDPRFLYVGL